MPKIVKFKYIAPLLAELAKPKYAGLSDAETVAKLNAPTATATKRYGPVSVESVVFCLVSRGKEAAVAKLVDTLQLPRDGMVNCTDDAPKAAIAKIVSGGLLTADDVAALRALSEQAVPGPSFAQSIDIGMVFEENIGQLRAYVGADDQAVREDLAGYLLSGLVRRAWLEKADVTADEIMETVAYAEKAKVVAAYTGVTDPARLKTIIDEALAALKEAK